MAAWPGFERDAVAAASGRVAAFCAAEAHVVMAAGAVFSLARVRKSEEAVETEPERPWERLSCGSDCMAGPFWSGLMPGVGNGAINVLPFG